jgi:hypothetical protein
MLHESWLTPAFSVDVSQCSSYFFLTPAFLRVCVVCRSRSQETGWSSPAALSPTTAASSPSAPAASPQPPSLLSSSETSSPWPCAL